MAIFSTLYNSEEEKKKERDVGQTAVKNTGVASATPKQNTQQAQQRAVSTPQKAVESTNPYKGYEYNPQTNQAYLDALAALQGVQGNKPTYGGTYDEELHALYDRIVGREKFRYNAAEDPMWQNYLEQYTTKGKMAMMDTMGQAAALTGGYGSSYGQQVGQQAYQGYLQEANQNLPQFYNMALDAYTREGDALNQQYAMLGDLQDTEYGRYMDALNQHWNEVNYQQGLADTAYDRGRENWYNAYQMGVDADNMAYTRQQEAYSKLENLIANTGYVPSAEELSAAGMSEAQAKAWKSYYDRMIAAGSGGSGGSGGGGGGSSKEKTTTSRGSSKEKTTTSKSYSNLNSKLAHMVTETGTTKDSVAGSLYSTLESAYNGGKISASEYNSLMAQYEPKAVAEDNARQNNGKPAVDVSTQVTLMRKKGASQSEINSYLKAAVSAGVITQKEADKLKSAR